MRRILRLVLAAAMTLMALPSFAGDGQRTVTRPYTITRGHIHFNSQDVGWMGTPAETFRARPGEDFVTIALSDDTGRPVRGRVQLGGEAVEFCSETSEPIAVSAGQKISVHAIFGQCDAGFSIATEGTITATFSK